MKTTCLPVGIRLVMVILLVLGTAGVCVARGDGIKAGDGRLHFGINLDLSYDTNPGYFRNSDPNVPGDLVLRMHPNLTLAFPSDSFSFDLTGMVGYDLYFGIIDSSTKDLSSIVGEANMKVGINPNGQFSFFLEDTFSRTGDPRYTSLSGKFNRTDNEAKAHFQIKPGGGALMFDLAYGFFIDWYDSVTTGQGNQTYSSDALDSYAHRVYFSGKWKFLPKTALTVDFDADIRRYPNSYQDGTKNMDVNAIRATVGMLGQITPSLSVVIKAGYGDTLMPSVQNYPDDNFRSVIGQAEITFAPGTTFLQVGYVRNFQPVVQFGYFGQDRIYARFKQQIAGKFALSADVGFDFLGYGTAVEQSARTGGRSDKFLTGDAAFDYFILDWLAVGLAYQVQALFSDYQMPQNNGGVEYSKHMFTLHIGIDY